MPRSKILCKIQSLVSPFGANNPEIQSILHGKYSPSAKKKARNWDRTVGGCRGDAGRTPWQVWKKTYTCTVCVYTVHIQYVYSCMWTTSTYAYTFMPPMCLEDEKNSEEFSEGSPPKTRNSGRILSSLIFMFYLSLLLWKFLGNGKKKAAGSFQGSSQAQIIIFHMKP